MTRAQKVAPNYAQALVHFAERLYGDKWQADLARALGVPKLRIHRIASAVREGRDYQGSRELLAELHEALAGVVGEMGRWVR